jgi:hypothetical protein
LLLKPVRAQDLQVLSKESTNVQELQTKATVKIVNIHLIWSADKTHTRNDLSYAGLMAER